MKTNTNIVLSKSELQERRRHMVYRVLPVISILLLIMLWLAAASGETSSFPSPMDVYERYMKFLEKPIQKLSLFGHIVASLKRVLLALVISWALGISFGILIV